LGERGEGEDETDLEERGALWAVGDVSDDDGDDGDDEEQHANIHQNKDANRGAGGSLGLGLSRLGRGEEATGLMDGQREVTDADSRRRSTSSDALVSEDPFRDDPEEFGEWEGAPRPNGQRP
jgi:hypothetical protein